MDAAIIVLLLLAALAANLPFITERVLLVRAARDNHKHFGWRLLEFVLLYFIVGLLALWLESRMGPVHTQRWPFYATTFALFVVAAAPGFVIRYFWRKPGV